MPKITVFTVDNMKNQEMFDDPTVKNFPGLRIETKEVSEKYIKHIDELIKKGITNEN